MHENGNLTTVDGMIVGKRDITYYANNPVVMIDVGSGTLLKLGDQLTNPLVDYYATAVAQYNKIGMTDMANDLMLINFDRYGKLDIDEMCTLINYFMNSIGPEKMLQLLNMSESEIKIKIAQLAEVGF